MKKFLVVVMASMLVLGVGMANKKVEASRDGESVDRITWVTKQLRKIYKN